MGIYRFLALLLAAAPLTMLAHADTFSFSYTGDGTSASGTLDGNLYSPGVYLIAQITGIRNGVAITGLDPIRHMLTSYSTFQPPIQALHSPLPISTTTASPLSPEA